MSEFKGTKGNWEQNRYCVFAGENEEIGKNVICRLHHGLNNYMGNEQPYNAQLIAHAPQMLDELKETVIDLKILRNQIEHANKTNHLFDGMADLIGKWIDRKEKLIQRATTIK